jgi:hypothetical protein
VRLAPVETLTKLGDRGPEALQTAMSVARWTIENIQDESG